jgi:hypothetical protein
MRRSLLRQLLSWTVDGADQLYREVTIGALPDEVLLDLFEFYVVQALDEDAWHTFSAYLPKLAMHRICVTATTESASSLHAK